MAGHVIISILFILNKISTSSLCYWKWCQNWVKPSWKDQPFQGEKNKHQFKCVSVGSIRRKVVWETWRKHRTARDIKQSCLEAPKALKSSKKIQWKWESKLQWYGTRENVKVRQGFSHSSTLKSVFQFPDFLKSRNKKGMSPSLSKQINLSLGCLREYISLAREI